MDSKANLPKLVVFDLDYTLWPFWVDAYVQPPFQKKSHVVHDMVESRVNFYPEVPRILEKLSNMNITMGVASRTSDPVAAERLFELFGWNKYLKYKEMYPGCKITHFNKLQAKGFEFSEMLFFDDEIRNIIDISKLDVTCVLVDNGMTLELLDHDMTLWPIHVDKYHFPFAKDSLGYIRDSVGIQIELYPETILVLETLLKRNIKMAVASRITDIASAYQLIHLFNLRKYFLFIEIYPTRKTLHFSQIKEKSGFHYRQMMFFDDDIRNLKCIEKLGVQVHQSYQPLY